jgi:large subunit ribosomal protein L19
LGIGNYLVLKNHRKKLAKGVIFSTIRPLLAYLSMSSQLLRKFTQKYCKETVPVLRAGYHVRVHQKIKEGNKERVQIFEGMVIRQNSGHGVNETFTVRKISNGVGVEKVFPIHAPSVVKIEVLRAHKVRRAKLHFLRELSGKALRLKEIPLNLKEKIFKKPAVAKAESVEATTEGMKVEKKPETEEKTDK